MTGVLHPLSAQLAQAHLRRQLLLSCHPDHSRKAAQPTHELETSANRLGATIQVPLRDLRPPAPSLALHGGKLRGELAPELDAGVASRSRALHLRKPGSQHHVLPGLDSLVDHVLPLILGDDSARCWVVPVVAQPVAHKEISGPSHPAICGPRQRPKKVLAPEIGNSDKSTLWRRHVNTPPVTKLELGPPQLELLHAHLGT